LRDLERRLNLRLAAISAIVVDQEDQIAGLRRDAEDLVTQHGLVEVALTIQASISELRSRISELDAQEKEIRASEKEKVELRIQLTKMTDVGVKHLQRDEEVKESDLRKQLEEMELEITQLEKEEKDLVLEIPVAEDRVEATDVEKVMERWNEGLDAEIARIEEQVARLKVVLDLESGLEADFGWSPT
jgi:chromosome segregation ATPase